MGDVTTTRGHVKVPKMHWRQQSLDQYGGHNGMVKALVREVIQNSRDAGASTLRLKVDDDGRWTFIDNGCGMTADEFREFYLTLGGTKKETGSIGGFGAAKRLISFSRKDWTAVGQGFSCDGEGVEWTMTEGDGVGRRTGFLIGGEGDDFEPAELGNALDRIVGLSNLPMDIFWREPRVHGTQYDEKNYQSKRAFKGRPLLDSQVVKAFEWGTLYVVKDPTLNDYETTGRCYVRSRGLYTFDFRVGGDALWYLELTGKSTKILTENRDSLRWHYRDMVTDQVEKLRLQGMKVKPTTATMTVYAPPPPEDEDVKTLDLRYPVGNLLADEIAAILAILGLDDISDLGVDENAYGTGFAITAAQADKLRRSAAGGAVNIHDYSPTKRQAETMPSTIELGDRREDHEIRTEELDLWREPIAIVHTSGKAPTVLTSNGNPRPKYSKALEIWKVAVDAVAEATGLPRPMLALTFDNEPAEGAPHKAIHGTFGRDHHVVGVRPEHALESTPYAILHTAEHEFAHYTIAWHQDRFIAEVGSIKRDIGPVAVEAIQAIADAQAAPARRGRYWREESS